MQVTPNPCPTLLPCPFCGGEARDWTHDSCDCCGKAVNGSVNCTVCGAGVTHRDSSEQATRDWNTRADLNNGVRERVEALHSDLRLVHGKYDYQCGFLDALKSVKALLAGDEHGN